MGLLDGTDDRTDDGTAELSRALAALFAVPVGLSAAAIGANDEHASALFPEELLVVQRAAPKRVAEYTAGRACARAALAQLGVAPLAIPSRADRTPVWPPGFAGSISHGAGRCVAVAAPLARVASLGIDVEGALLHDATLYRHICHADQLAALAARAELPLPAWIALMFSAKEAFYKAWFPLTGRFLEFDEVRVEFTVAPGGSAGTFSASLADPALSLPAGVHWSGRWQRHGAQVYTGMTCMRQA